MKNLSWKNYYMLQAIIASLKSKDPSTKVGCVIVDDSNTQVSMGYNGFPRGVDESKLTWNNDLSKGIENTKYPYVIHSEINAIINARKSVSGCTMYVTLYPCEECAKLVAASGIKKVYYSEYRKNELTERIFELANIQSEQVKIESDKIIKCIEGLI